MHQAEKILPDSFSAMLSWDVEIEQPQQMQEHPGRQGFKSFINADLRYCLKYKDFFMAYPLIPP